MKAFGVFIFLLGCFSVLGIIVGFFIEDYDQRIEALMGIALFCMTVLMGLFFFKFQQDWGKCKK